MLIGAAQSAHRPRSSSQPSTGTLCRLRTALPQCGQCDPGRTSDSSRGTRWITTFRNDPTARPSRATMPSSSGWGMAVLLGLVGGWDRVAPSSAPPGSDGSGAGGDVGVLDGLHGAALGAVVD